MAVFMDSQHLLPGKAAQIKAILFGCQLKFAPEGRKLYIAIGNNGLILEDDIDLPLRMTDSRQCSVAQRVYDGRHLLGL